MRYTDHGPLRCPFASCAELSVRGMPNVRIPHNDALVLSVDASSTTIVSMSNSCPCAPCDITVIQRFPDKRGSVVRRNDDANERSAPFHHRRGCSRNGDRNPIYCWAPAVPTAGVPTGPVARMLILLMRCVVGAGLFPGMSALLLGVVGSARESRTQTATATEPQSYLASGLPE